MPCSGVVNYLHCVIITLPLLLILPHYITNPIIFCTNYLHIALPLPLPPKLHTALQLPLPLSFRILGACSCHT